MHSDIVDVAIVGGGVAGAYLAWRLGHADSRASPALQALSERRPDHRLKIHLYEQSERIGGRLHSLSVRGLTKTCAELGGMRYYPTHRLVDNLIKHLKLPTKNFLSAPSDNFLFLRHQRLRQSQLRTRNSMLLYALPQEDRNKTPAELILRAISSVIPDARRSEGESLHNWKQRWQAIKASARFDQRELYNLGFWDLLQAILNPEAYRFVLDAGGYSDFFQDWNAAEAMDWFVSDFLGLDNPNEKVENVPLALVKGFDQLPKILVEQFRARYSEGVFLDHQLLAFEKDKENAALLRLTFEDRAHHRRFQIKAHHLALAIPQRALQLLDQSAEFFQSEQIQSDIAAVFAEPAMKLFLGYKEAWWKPLGLHAGASITDLPIRLAYYWDTPAEANALLLASYCYGDLPALWGKALDPRLPLFEVDRSVEPSYSEKLERAHLPSQELVNRVQEELRQLHGLSSQIPDPYVALVCDWSRDPYAGAWHLWKAGIKPWEVIARLRQPRAEYNVYICGEAYSAAQSWVEGALISTENLLEKIFRLPRPNWLPTDYYLGP
jgi:monoamine oxidase